MANLNFLHGGNIYETKRKYKKEIIDFSANINPLGLPTYMKEIIRSNIKNILHYPDPQNTEFKIALSKYLKLSNKNIIIGNGSTELIYLAAYAIKPETALIVTPTFSEYEKVLINIGANIEYLPLKEKDGFNIAIKKIITRIDKVEVIFLCNPNNPTGKIICREDLIYLVKKLRGKGIALILDEAFIDMTEENSLVDIAPKNNNLFVLRSLTKFFSLPGLRLGYGIGAEKLIRKLKNLRQPWSVNIFAQTVGTKLIQDKQFKRISKKFLLKERDFLYQQLLRIKTLMPYHSCANFILIKILTSSSSGKLQKTLLKKGILIRDCSNFRGLNDKFIRVAVKSRKENLRLISEIKTYLSPRR